MLKQTPIKRVLFMRRYVPVLLAVFGVFSLTYVQMQSVTVASAAASNTINFQARLQSASGAIVPDGNYNVEFKLYSGSSCNPTTGTSCTLEWTEDYLNSASQGLQTVNGYLSANLGSITTFPTTIKWDQQHWLSMNIGGTSTGSVTWDGEMKPYLNLTAVPEAFSANQLASTSASGRSTLTFQGSSSGDQNFVIQDQGAAGTYNLLTTNVANSSFIQLQGSTPGTAQTGNFNISGTGVAAILQGSTAIKTPAIRPVSDSTTALKFQNAAGTVNVLTVDTTNDRIGIGTTSPAANLDVQGATSDSSTVAFSVENAASGSIISARDDGQVSIGTTAASGTSTTFGSTANTTPDTGGGDSNYFTATKFTTGTHAGTLTSISIYVNAIDPSSVNDKFRLAIYADAGTNQPTTLVAQSAEGTLTANTFNTLAVSASLGANTTYWLAYQTNGTSIPYNDFSYASGASNQYYSYSNPYGTFPSTAGSGGAHGAVAQAIYATYTEAGTGTMPALTVAASGNIGVGKTAPVYALDVSGTGSFSTSILSPQLDNAGALSIGTSTATSITVGTTSTTGTLTLGQSTAANTVNIANGAVTATQTVNIATGATGGSGADVVTIGSTLNSSATTIQGGSGGLQLQVGTASTISIGTTIQTTTLSIGNASASTTASITGGTGSNAVNIQAGSAGTISIGTQSANVITIGNTTSNNALKMQADGISQTMTGSATAPSDTIKTTTNSASAFQIQNASSTNLFNVDTSGGNVNLGIGTPPSQLGYTTVGASTGTAYNGTINANKFTAAQTGTVSTMSVYVPSPNSSPNNHFQVGIYTNSGGVPSAYIASSASTVLTSGWNTVALTTTPTLNSGTTYWLVYWADVNNGSNSGMAGDSPVTGAVYYFASSTYASGASNGMPTTFPAGTNAGTVQHSIYVTFASTSYAATISSAGSLSVTGAATFIDNSNSTTAFQIQNSAGTTFFGVDTSNEKVIIGPSAGDTTGAILVLGNKTTSGDPTEVDGAMYYNSNAGGFRCGVSGTWQSCIGGLLKAQTSVQGGDTIAGNSAETNFATNYSLPANYCVAGRVIRVTAQGVWSTNATGTNAPVIRVKLGSTAIGATTSVTVTNGLSNQAWRAEFQIICDAAPGATSAVEGQGQATLYTDTGTGVLHSMGNTGTINVATNAAQTLQLSTQWGNTNAGNSFTMRQLLVEGLGP